MDREGIAGVDERPLSLDRRGPNASALPRQTPWETIAFLEKLNETETGRDRPGLIAMLHDRRLHLKI
jgi:hypothetical protein